MEEKLSITYVARNIGEGYIYIYITNQLNI